jgi:hypothetical protein
VGSVVRPTRSRATKSQELRGLDLQRSAAGLPWDLQQCSEEPAGGEDKMAQGESDRRRTVRSGDGKWIRRLAFSCFRRAGSGRSRHELFGPLPFHEGDRGPLLSGNRK